MYIVARQGMNRGGVYETIFFPGEKKGVPVLVINSNSWESHVLSGEKKTGAAFQPWAGPGWAGLSPDLMESGYEWEKKMGAWPGQAWPRPA